MRPNDAQLQILDTAAALGTAWISGSGRDPVYRQNVVRMIALGWLSAERGNPITTEGEGKRALADSTRRAISTMASTGQGGAE